MSTKIGQSIMHDLRVRLYAHLQSLSLSFFASTRSGEIQSRIASDIGGLQTLVTNTANELARNLSIVVMTAIAMFLLDWRLALFSMIAVPVSILLSDRVGKLRETITHEQQVRLGDMSAAVQESLSISGIILAARWVAVSISRGVSRIRQTISPSWKSALIRQASGNGS